MTSYGGAIKAPSRSVARYRSPRKGTTRSEDAMSFRDAQQAVDRWIGQYKEGYFPPLTILARLTEEVGELARELNHRFGEKTKKPEEPEGSLAMELADILFVVICLANSQGISLDDAVRPMMQNVTSRAAARA